MFVMTVLVMVYLNYKNWKVQRKLNASSAPVSPTKGYLILSLARLCQFAIFIELTYYLGSTSLKAMKQLRRFFSGSTYDRQTRYLLIILIVVPIFALVWKAFTVYVIIEDTYNYYHTGLEEGRDATICTPREFRRILDQLIFPLVFTGVPIIIIYVYHFINFLTHLQETKEYGKDTDDVKLMISMDSGTLYSESRSPSCSKSTEKKLSLMSCANRDSRHSTESTKAMRNDDHIVHDPTMSFPMYVAEDKS